MDCDIVCLPSYREGTSLTLIEAAAYGRAIVTSDAPGCHDFLKHNVEGLVVPAKQMEPLLEALKKLIEDPKLLKDFGRRGTMPNAPIAKMFSSANTSNSIPVRCQASLLDAPSP
ncbi:MAG: glycosyltransferase [Bdellovibrionales bacterium]